MVKRLVVGPFQANCYIWVDEASGSAAVIDPGEDAATISRILTESGAKFTHILLTHIHPDHMFAAGELQEEYPDVELMLHRADFESLSEEMVDMAAMFFDMRRFKPFKPTGYVEEGQPVRVGETEINVIHTPGHTPGGVCFGVDGILFTGDTLFASGIGRTDLPGGSYEQLMQSITEKLMTLPDELVIYPGHGSESTIGEERRSNPWLE